MQKKGRMITMTEKIKDFFTDVLINLIYFDKNFEYEPGFREDTDGPHAKHRDWWRNYLTNLIFSLFLGCFAVFMSFGALTADQRMDEQTFDLNPSKVGVSDPPEGFDDKNNKNIADNEIPIKGFDMLDILIGNNLFFKEEKDEKAVVVKREVEPAIVVAAVNEPKIYE